MTDLLPAVSLADAQTANGESLFASRFWLQLWLDTFGGPQSGWWVLPSAGTSTTEFPYVIDARKIGPFRLRVASAAVNSYTPRFDVVGSTVTDSTELCKMMAELRVSALLIPLVPRNSIVAHLIEHCGSLISWHRDICEGVPYVDCTGDWEEYLLSRGKTRRATWLRKERRAQKAGYTFENHANWKDVADTFDEMLAVEASGWKGQAGTAIAQDPALRNFYTRLCQDLMERGSLHIFVLRRESRIIAFHICPLYGGTLSSLKLGYLEEHSTDSPGQVLQLHMLRWAFSQPSIRIFDMGGPESVTKMRWATGVEQLYTYYVFRASLGGLLARFRWEIGPRLKAKLTRPRARVSLPDAGADGEGG